MSFVESLHQARKARLKRMAAAAVAQAPSGAGRPSQQPAPRALDPAYERAWAAVILGCDVERPPPRLRVADIQLATARHFNIELDELLSAERGLRVVRPRQIAMYLAKHLTPKSFPEIARRFGDRDHTAVLHAVRRIEHLIRKDGALADSVACIKQALQDIELRP